MGFYTNVRYVGKPGCEVEPREDQNDFFFIFFIVLDLFFFWSFFFFFVGVCVSLLS